MSLRPVRLGNIIMTELEMGDAFGVPEYFATLCNVEDAGGGCVRIYGCTERHGVLIQHYTVVMPAQNMMRASQRVMEISKRILCGVGMAH